MNYVRKLKGKSLEAAARLATDNDFIAFLEYLNGEKDEIAQNCARETEVNMTLRYQGAFLAFEELLKYLVGARKQFEAERELERNKRKDPSTW